MKKDKHKFWIEIAVTLVLTAIFLILPFALFWNELDHVGSFWYVVIAKWLILPVNIGVAFFVLKWRNDPNKDWLRRLCLALAVAFAAITMLPASQYRADKSDNIHWDASRKFHGTK